MLLGTNNISSLYLGDKSVSKAYLGDKLVFSQSTLPYRELKWIESNGTQKIELPEVIFTTTLGSFQMGIRFTKENSSQYMGAAYSTGKMWGIVDNCFALGSKYKISASISPFEWQTVTGAYDSWNFNLTVQNNTITATRSSAISAYGAFYLFGFKNDTSFAEKCSAQLEYAQFFNTGGEMVLDLVPVLDDVGVPCLYDMLNGGLYYSSDGDEFGYEVK